MTTPQVAFKSIGSLETNDNLSSHNNNWINYELYIYINEICFFTLTGDAAGHSGIQTGSQNRQISTAVNYHGDHGSITIHVVGAQGDGAEAEMEGKDDDKEDGKGDSGNGAAPRT